MGIMMVPLADGDEKKKSAFNEELRLSSPFSNGATFTIKGFSFVQYEVDGKLKERVHPVLETSLGQLPLTLLHRARVDKDGKIHRPGGTFVEQVLSLITNGITNGQFLEKVVEMFKDKAIKVKSEDIVCKGQYGDFAASVKSFDVV